MLEMYEDLAVISSTWIMDFSPLQILKSLSNWIYLKKKNSA